MISVILPVRNEPYLNKTIESLYETASNIEVIVILDGALQPVDKRAKVITYSEPQGRRVAINDAARIARGKHLFILDAHCLMSNDWVEKMVAASEPNAIVISSIQDIDPETWKPRPGIYDYVYINERFVEKWWKRKSDKVVDETMGFTGCAWLIEKSYYWKLNGYDESFGMYGGDGPEWSLKVWLNDGRLLIHKGVICYHVFGTNNGSKLYPVSTIGDEAYYAKMMKLWGDKFHILLEKFPDANVNFGDKKMAVNKVTETVVRKKDDVVKKDSDGKIISHVVKHYKPFAVKHDGSKSDGQITQEALPKITEVEREEVLV